MPHILKVFCFLETHGIPPSNHVFFSPKILLSFVGKYMFDELKEKMFSEVEMWLASGISCSGRRKLDNKIQMLKFRLKAGMDYTRIFDKPIFNI